MQSGLIQRNVLLERLRLVLDRRVVLIVAPPGCGKTILVRQLLEDKVSSTVWMRLTESSSPDSLLADILKALAGLLGFTNFKSRSLHLATEAMIFELRDYAEANFEGELVFVFDDVQNLAVAGVFFDALFRGLPQFCRYILIARELPRLDYVQLKLRDDLAVFIEDLYFSRDEVYELGRLLLGDQSSKDFAERVWRELRGWPMGTIAYFDAGETYSKSVQGQLFSGFAEEMLGKLLPTQRQRILEMATFEEITYEMSREILGISEEEFGSFLSLLREKGFFIYEENSRYRFHDLFREFLIKELNAENPDRSRELRLEFGFWLYKKGNLKRAIAEFLVIGDYLRGFELLRAEFDSALQGLGDVVFIESLVRLLLDSSVRGNLWKGMGFSFAVFLMRFLRLKVFTGKEIRYQLAGLALEDKEWSDYPHYKFALWGFYIAKFTNVREREEFERRADEFVTAYQGFVFSDGMLAEIPLIDHLYSPLDRFLVNQAVFNGDYQSAYEVFVCVIERLDSRLEEISAIDYYQIYIAACVVYKMVLGPQNGVSSPLYNVLRRVVAEYGETFIADDCFVALSDDREETGVSLEESFVYFSSMQNRIGKNSSQYRDFALQYAELLTYLGDLERAYRYRLSCFDMGNPNSHNNFVYNYNMTLTLFALGQRDSALSLVESTYDLAVKNKNKLFTDVFSDLRVLVTLEPWNTSSVSKSALSDVFTASFPLFVAAYFRRDFAEMDRLLTEHLKQWADLEYFILMYLFVLGHDSRFVYSKEFLTYPALSALYQRVSAATERYRLSLRQPRFPGSIRVLMLGAELLQLDGRSIDYKQWLSSKNRLIFYYLVLKGPASAEDLASLLWLEKDPKAASTSMRKAIQWLRDVLGDAVILFEDGQYKINPAIQIHSDVTDLKEWVSRLLQRSTRILAFDQVADLVSGDFLPKLDLLWVDEQRRSLRVVQLGLLSRYANIQQRNGDYRAALRSFELLLQKDSYFEDAWRGAMETLAKLGERARLVVLYRELCELFELELGVIPSKQTRDLYDKLVLEDV